MFVSNDVADLFEIIIIPKSGWFDVSGDTVEEEELDLSK